MAAPTKPPFGSSGLEDATVARCEICRAGERVAGPPDEARALLEARDWLHCPRGGREVAWRCPEHNPLKLPRRSRRARPANDTHDARDMDGEPGDGDELSW